MAKERVIQFGEGGFLRGFVDYFLYKLNEKEVWEGKVVVVQPIEKGMCDLLSSQNCEYNLYLRGIENGETVVVVLNHFLSFGLPVRCVVPSGLHFINGFVNALGMDMAGIVTGCIEELSAAVFLIDSVHRFHFSVCQRSSPHIVIP